MKSACSDAGPKNNSKLIFVNKIYIWYLYYFLPLYFKKAKHARKGNKWLVTTCDRDQWTDMLHGVCMCRVVYIYSTCVFRPSTFIFARFYSFYNNNNHWKLELGS